MLCHLTPYFHLLTHFILFICKFGPVYAWWAYVYERFNGWLSKVNHNGHKGGELEATLMRSWTKLHLINDLVIAQEPSSIGRAKCLTRYLFTDFKATRPRGEQVAEGRGQHH
ncbi:hypothetical protein C2E23DRAFT_722392 [Lenzites betulinus]|nr:hypothetical protein C2E23DRAFT_722392 [Lenzites betulinus]